MFVTEKIDINMKIKRYLKRTLFFNIYLKDKINFMTLSCNKYYKYIIL
jgi:hypothetical protein